MKPLKRSWIQLKPARRSKFPVARGGNMKLYKPRGNGWRLRGFTTCPFQSIWLCGNTIKLRPGLTDEASRFQWRLCLKSRIGIAHGIEGRPVGIPWKWTWLTYSLPCLAETPGTPHVLTCLLINTSYSVIACHSLLGAPHSTSSSFVWRQCPVQRRYFCGQLLTHRNI